MICVAAAALVGCQNVDDINDGALGGVNFKATASTPELSRTELVYADGAYKAQWCEGDQVALIEVATVDAENATITKYESNALTAAAESAEFSFNVDAATAESYQYVLAYPYGNVGIADATAVNLTLATNQVKKDASFGANCDLLIAKSDVLAAQPESVAFTLTRLSAVAKMTLKNFAIPAGEVIEDVTLSCEQPLTGTIGVNYADLSWSVVSGVNSVTTTNYEWTVTADGTLDVYFSVLPATLAAGESYTITVETDKATYIKEATLAVALQFKAGDITTFAANMNGAASKTKLANLSEEYEYALGYTDANGAVWLLPKTAVNRRPSGHQVGVAGTGYNEESYDLTSISVDAKGTLVGDVAALYRWKVAKTDDGLYNFYTLNNDNEPVYMVAYGEKDASGLAIKGYNSDGKFQAQYGTDYENTFSIIAKEGGYDIQFVPASGSATYSYAYFTGTQMRIGKTSPAKAAWNFYRIQPAPARTLYPVITSAADITEGTYVFLSKKADGTYYAMANSTTISEGANTCPYAYPISEVAMTIDEDGCVVTAEIADSFKWVITQRGETTNWDVRSAVDMTMFLWMRGAGAGVAIGTKGDVTAVQDDFSPSWNFFDDAEKGMQAQTPIAATKGRWLYVGAAAASPTGYQWLGAKLATDALVLVKLSNSTEQIQ